MPETPRSICHRFGAALAPPGPAETLGISASALRGDWPLHGLRHRPENGSSGWFIWASEVSEDADFFMPLHVRHLSADCPAAVPYLALPPGWRFLLAPGHEDVWYDPGLLDD